MWVSYKKENKEIWSQEIKMWYLNQRLLDHFKRHGVANNISYSMKTLH